MKKRREALKNQWFLRIEQTNPNLSPYLCSINPMNEKINPTTPIPIANNSIPDEQSAITIAKSSIAIPNAIFFIIPPPLQIPIIRLIFLHYTIRLFPCHFISRPYEKRVKHYCPLFFQTFYLIHYFTLYHIQMRKNRTYL